MATQLSFALHSPSHIAPSACRLISRTFNLGVRCPNDYTIGFWHKFSPVSHFHQFLVYFTYALGSIRLHHCLIPTSPLSHFPLCLDFVFILFRCQIARMTTPLPSRHYQNASNVWTMMPGQFQTTAFCKSHFRSQVLHNIASCCNLLVFILLSLSECQGGTYYPKAKAFSWDSNVLQTIIMLVPIVFQIITLPLHY
jgi:hypothetical protein